MIYDETLSVLVAALFQSELQDALNTLEKLRNSAKISLTWMQDDENIFADISSFVYGIDCNWGSK